MDQYERKMMEEFLFQECGYYYDELEDMSDSEVKGLYEGEKELMASEKAEEERKRHVDPWNRLPE